MRRPDEKKKCEEESWQDSGSEPPKKSSRRSRRPADVTLPYTPRLPPSLPPVLGNKVLADVRAALEDALFGRLETLAAAIDEARRPASTQPGASICLRRG